MKNRKFAAAQKNYMVAQAHFETVKASYQAEYDAKNLDDLYERDFDRAFDLDEEVNAKHGYDAAYQLLSNAGSQLIEWSFDVVRGNILYKMNKKDLDYLFDNYKTNFSVKDKLIDLAMKLAA